jgi:hypothetical protein
MLLLFAFWRAYEYCLLLVSPTKHDFVGYQYSSYNDRRQAKNSEVSDFGTHIDYRMYHMYNYGSLRTNTTDSTGTATAIFFRHEFLP